MAADRKPRNVKTTISLPPDAAEALRALAEERNTTLAEVIRRAISVDKYLGDARKAGSRILVEDAEKAIKELILF
jgi:predicted transcriptional regulator